jgi:NAD(P)H-dependent FMN reductase
MSEPLRLEIILGTVRPNRFGPVVAQWFLRQAEADPRFDTELLDLADFPLPSDLTMDGDAAQAFQQRIKAADAIVAVTPEYNHSTSGALKNAFDLLKREWRAKPVGFVSYGGLSGGLRATEHLRQVVAELHMVSVRETVSFYQAKKRLDADGNTADGAAIDASVRLLNQLEWWGRHLREARSTDPYPA